MGRWEVIGEDQRLGTENLRLELVLKKENDILIVDVTAPFEKGLKAFEDARLVKEAKYTNLTRELTTDGNKAKIKAIIVGSLGFWDPRNDRIIKCLCSSTYTKLMRKLIVSETIGNSCNIYFEHISGVHRDRDVDSGLDQI